MTKPTDQEIEHVARAMCAACGEDPDKPRWDEIPQGEKWWECWKDDAMEFLGAYRAMQEWH